MRRVLVVAAAVIVCLTLASLMRASVSRIEALLRVSGDLLTFDRRLGELHALEGSLVGGDAAAAATLEPLGAARQLLLDAGGVVADRREVDPGLPTLLSAQEGYIDSIDRVIQALTRGDLAQARAEVLAGEASFARLSEATREAEQGLLARQLGALRVNQAQMLGVLLFGTLAVSAISLRAFASLERGEERFRAFTEHATGLLWVVDVGGRITYSTPSVRQAVGSAGSQVGANFFDAVHPDDLDRAHAFMSYLSSQPGGLHTFEGRFRSDHETGPLLEVVGRCLTDNPSVQGIVLNARDVTEHKAYEASLRREALHDGLTQLPNRSLFLDRARAALAACGHDRTLTFAVIYIDLDGFKEVNDKMGHAVGDELLVAVSARLSDTLRIIGRARQPMGTSGPKRAPGTDTLARIGGDEFIALLNHTKNAANALQAATRLLSTLRQPFSIAGNELHVSASLGVAIGPGDYASVDDLIRDADAAMYRAKAAGRAQVRIFDTDVETKAAQTVRLRGEIRAGIENKDFVVLYQPIVSLETGSLHGCEALVRWKRAGTLVPPEDFLEVAEETGSIIPLGRWVLLQAVRQAQDWRRACPTLPPGFVTVNVSSKELVDANFVSQIDDIVATNGIDRADLKLEFTEAIAVQDPANTIAVIRQLRSRGHKVTMDDFGTGHSLLTWFQQLPIDGFKIDRSFVRDIETSARSVNIVRLMIDMAKTAEIEVVAEGVETERQSSILRELGCAFGQGYLFGKPLEADELYDTFIKSNT